MSLSHALDFSKRRVGVVKPYAVVDIDEDTDRGIEDESDLDFLKRETLQVDTKVSKQHPLASPGQQCSDAGAPVHRSSQTNSPLEPPPRRTHETSAKRKAPLPPPRMLSNSGSPISTISTSEANVTQASKLPSPHPVLKNDTKSIYTFQAKSESTSTFRSRAKTIASSDGSDICREDKTNKKKPPEKPPRTFSTFLSADEQDDLVLSLKVHQQLSQPHNGYSTAMSQSASRCKTTLTSTKSAVATAYPLVMEVISETLHKMYLSSMERVLCTDNLWHLSWDDVTVASEAAISYKEIQFHVEVSIYIYKGWFRILTPCIASR